MGFQSIFPRIIFIFFFLMILPQAEAVPIGIANYTENVIGSGNDVNGIYDFQIIDYNGNGDLDIISAALVSDELNWWRNTGDNLTFTAILIQDNADTDALRSLYVIDFDGDGDYDIIYSAGNENRIAWLENDGSNFSYTDHQVCESATTCDDPWSAEVADMNGDGFYDIVFAENDDDAIQVWINDADGTNTSFSQSTILSGANLDQVEDIKVIDFDGDGDLDVAYAALAEDRLGIARNDGAYPFTDVEVCEGGAVCDAVRDVEVIDFDGDGFLDIVSASYNDDQLFWYENDGTNASFARHLVGSGAGQLDGAKDTAVADFDFDGDYDIIVACYSPGQVVGRLAWWNNSGDNTIFAEVLIDDTSATDGAWRVEVTDFDGDEDLDIVLGSYDEDRLSWWETGSTDIYPPQYFNITEEPSSPASVSAAYYFNSTWTDNKEIGTIIIQHNFSGALANYTVNTKTGDEYYYNYSGLSTIYYQYRWFANDTSGNENQTPVYLYWVRPRPIVNIIDPSNRTFINQSYIPLSYSISSTNPISACWYNINEGANITLQGCANTTFNVSLDGSYKINIYSNDTDGEVGKGTSYFSVDTTPVIISVESISNQSYGYGPVDYNITVSKSLTWAYVSIDGSSNKTLSNDSVLHWFNSTLSFPVVGEHNATFWVNSTWGQMNRTTVHFQVLANLTFKNFSSLVPVQIIKPASYITIGKFTLNATGEDVNITSLKVRLLGNYDPSRVNVSLYEDLNGDTGTGSGSTGEDILISGPFPFSSSTRTYAFSGSSLLAVNTSAQRIIVIYYDVS